jgi:hypothetical protein
LLLDVGVQRQLRFLTIDGKRSNTVQQQS